MSIYFWPCKCSVGLMNSQFYFLPHIYAFFCFNWHHFAWSGEGCTHFKRNSFCKYSFFTMTICIHCDIVAQTHMKMWRFGFRTHFHKRCSNVWQKQLLLSLNKMSFFPQPISFFSLDYTSSPQILDSLLNPFHLFSHWHIICINQGVFYIH